MQECVVVDLNKVTAHGFISCIPNYSMKWRILLDPVRKTTCFFAKPRPTRKLVVLIREITRPRGRINWWFESFTTLNLVVSKLSWFWTPGPKPSNFWPVFRIHGILVRNRIRIRGSMPLTNGSGSGFGSGSCYFRHWPSRCQQKTNFLTKFFLLVTFWRYIYVIFQR